MIGPLGGEPKERMMSDARPRLRRSSDRIIAGVCGGIAEWVGWDPTLVRILYVVASMLSAAFPGIVVYIVLWIVMPKADSPPGVDRG